MWTKPFAQVVVRPSRYTYQFMEQYDTFTLCAFPQDYRDALQLLGSRSGRDGDKIAKSGLTPIASSQVAAPGFAEAELIVECQKMYWQDMIPTHFLKPEIKKNYPDKDYHRIYFGEIVAILGTEAYNAELG
jgi:flavin reductase (DIM6/NTAB) family NADH-FMN oxidoreductase RutF